MWPRVIICHNGLSPAFAKALRRELRHVPPEIVCADGGTAPFTDSSAVGHAIAVPCTPDGLIWSPWIRSVYPDAQERLRTRIASLPFYYRGRPCGGQGHLPVGSCQILSQGTPLLACPSDPGGVAGMPGTLVSVVYSATTAAIISALMWNMACVPDGPPRISHLWVFPMGSDDALCANAMCQAITAAYREREILSVPFAQRVTFEQHQMLLSDPLARMEVPRGCMTLKQYYDTVSDEAAAGRLGRTYTAYRELQSLDIFTFQTRDRPVIPADSAAHVPDIVTEL